MLSTINHQPSTTLAILAGGKATRLGGINKALIEIEGETIISKIYRTLSPLCNEVLVISNQQQTDYNIRAKIYSDIIEKCGPLSGIHSALHNSSNETVIIVSCDMPYINSDIASKLVDEYIANQPLADIVIPTINGFKEPLLAIYSKGVSEKIAKILSNRKGHPITDLLEICNTMYVEIEATAENTKSFTNINTLDDFNAIKRNAK